ncbi:MAG: multiheme c-type cytochrome [Fibrobacterales bacterium]
MKKLLIMTAIISSAFIGCTEDSATAPIVDQDASYDRHEGASDCASCHATQFANWKESGHAFKLNKVVGDSIPAFPFTDIAAMFPNTVTNSLAEVPDAQMSLATTGYIVGGYGWKARYIDTSGLIIHGANAQYNFASGEFSAYHDGEAHSAYACGSCHATGWDPTATNPDAPLMAGNMQYDAITCQRCHGDNVVAGPGHNTKTFTAINAQNSSDVQGAVAEFGALGATHKANTVCAVCHVRGDKAKVVKVSSGLIKHHEQSHELLVGKGGAAHGCVTCHDPHSSVKFDAQASGQGVTKDCSVCHNETSTKPITVNAAYTGHNCTSCHMPKIVKSATTSTATYVTGVTALGIPGGKTGDMRSHILSLSSISDTNFVAADLDGTTNAISIPVDYSCMTCHGVGGAGPTTGAAAAAMLITTPVHP